MSLELPYSIKVLSTESLDEKYLNGLVPYTSIAQVNSLLPIGIRSIGLTVNIVNQEYWYKDNTTDGGLVLKIDINDANLLHTTGNETKNGTLIVNDTGDGYGVQGNSIDGTGVYGTSDNSAGVYGTSVNNFGVLGYTTNGTGVIGNSANGIGVEGNSLTNLAGRFDTLGTKIVSFLTNGVEQAYILATGLFKANKILINTTTDNGVDDLQVNGTISATAASTASQVVIKSQLDAKQDTLTSGTNIKTINSTSILGGGDIVVGDMILSSSQSVSGLKTFLNGAFGLRNVANTFTSFFSNANTASRTYTLQDKSYTLADIAITVRKISTATTLAESDNGTVILLTASCTVTLPNGLSLGWNCSFVTSAGVTMTYALGGSIVLINNTATTMAGKLSHTITNTGVLNEYITVGL